MFTIINMAKMKHYFVGIKILVKIIIFYNFEILIFFIIYQFLYRKKSHKTHILNSSLGVDRKEISCRESIQGYGRSSCELDVMDFLPSTAYQNTFDLSVSIFKCGIKKTRLRRKKNPHHIRWLCMFLKF